VPDHADLCPSAQVESEFVLLLETGPLSAAATEPGPSLKGILMHATKVLEHLKKHGQLLDFDIAAAINMPLDQVRASLAELSARGDISRCSVTSYVKGKVIEGFQCRVSGYIPRPAPGRKPGVK
jgi:hypothetical protein